MSQHEALGAEQQKLSDLWDEHVRTKFGAHAADETIGTMVENPLVKQLSVLIGGNGRREVYEFYSKHFLSQIPPDMEILSVSRTIGRDSLVDEVVARFTHTISMDWLLPGIPPTGKRVEIAFVAVVKFAGNKLAHEHLYWDQAQHFNAVCVISKLVRSTPQYISETTWPRAMLFEPGVPSVRVSILQRHVTTSCRTITPKLKTAAPGDHALSPAKQKQRNSV